MSVVSSVWASCIPIPITLCVFDGHKVTVGRSRGKFIEFNILFEYEILWKFPNMKLEAPSNGWAPQ